LVCRSQRLPVHISRLHLSESIVASQSSVDAAAAELRLANLYPDPHCVDLVNALAERWIVDPTHIAVGNGTDELLLLAALALGATASPGVVTAGTFLGHRFALEVAHRPVREVPLSAGRIDVPAVVRALDGAGIAFVCTPHNPSGVALNEAEVGALVAAAAHHGVALVFDEAYMEFAPDGTPSAVGHVRAGARLVALRTFSKAYGLAGLRVGYAVAHGDMAAELRRAQRVLPFRVNRLAQAAAVAALADGDALPRVQAETAEKRRWFSQILRTAGFEVPPSASNFVAVAVPEPGRVAALLLERYAIAVRDASDMGYSGHLRISLGTREEMRRVLAGLVEFCGRGRYLIPPDRTRDS
jgi:histidinol-phosphate aminotransferase